MEKKRKNMKKTIIPIVYVAYCIMVAILDFCTKGENRYIFYLKVGTPIICIVYLIIVVAQLLRALWPAILKWSRNWRAIIWTVAITLIIPIIIHFVFYSGETIDQDTMMSAYTGYLSFVGAFSLGYFLYKREELKNYETQKKKARLIYESMQYIQINFDNIDSFIERGETYPIAENWRSDYLDIKHLVKYDEFALGYELQYFFGRVEAINKAIVAVDKVRAKRLYLDFLQKEKYSASGYNYMDAGSVMLLISLDMPQHNTWKEIEKD